MNEVKCIGCGAILQSQNKNMPGYIPQSGMEKADAICQRCYRLKHYNEVVDVDVSSGDFLTMLNSLYEVDGVIIKVIDVFDFDGSLIPSFNRIVGNKKVIAVINKIDLLPKSRNVNRLIFRAKQMLKEAGITVQETIAISALKSKNIEALINVIKQYSEGKDIYVVGTTNVGKSTLINKLIESTTGDKNVITTSKFPGTTLDLIDIPIGENQFIFDTPGIIVDSQMAHFVTPKDLKIITPLKEIKPKNFQLNSEQTIFIGNLAQIDFIKGAKNTFTFYTSPNITLHRTKLNNASHFYQEHFNTLLAPPSINEDNSLINNYDEYHFNTTETSEVVISGLAFVTIPSGVSVTVKVLKGVGVSLRKTIFKGD